MHQLRTTTLENVKLGQENIVISFLVLVLVQVLERFLYQLIRFLQEINERAVKCWNYEPYTNAKYHYNVTEKLEKKENDKSIYVSH